MLKGLNMRKIALGLIFFFFSHVSVASEALELPSKTQRIDWMLDAPQPLRIDNDLWPVIMQDLDKKDRRSLAASCWRAQGQQPHV